MMNLIQELYNQPVIIRDTFFSVIKRIFNLSLLGQDV